ncbi:sodium/glutamate symporter [Vagococcus sp. DIV0080]|uniref:Sodium/glutamate symporter n=1 Tax=Candidatus Vagococcus giribetii TaxID=2230876 RepID=A0ABS3HUQ2_9ENTE|nr:sodium/glutamate symporter [Vagococcus sp. DIV0080]MBO0477474.1 sodium/glutamate symporter [Vagococcus sp. DIV0080]
MKLETIDGIQNLQLDMIATLALAGVLLMLGYFIRNKVKLLDRLCIPAPVIGGLLFSLIVWGFRSSEVLIINMDTTLQLPFMLTFFTCVGFGGSFKLLKSGGKLLVLFLVACWILAIIQNVVGVSLASVLGLNPVLGVMAGTVSLVGGHGNAAAFGPVAENLGVTGATTVAVASATFGLITGSLIGGPVGNWLIKKNKLEIKTDESVEEKSEEDVISENDFKVKSFLSHLTLIFIFMFGGIVISDLVSKLGIQNFALPNYVGAMFLAIIFRNLNDKKNIFDLNFKEINIIMEVGLSFFLTMATMTLKIWELADLAGPLLILLVVQMIIVILFSLFIVFPMLGKTYDSAVMTGGYAGWGLGISATAVVCMSAICEKYNLRSTKAFLIVPLCGAVFVDIVAVPIIIFFITKFA